MNESDDRLRNALRDTLQATEDCRDRKTLCLFADRTLWKANPDAARSLRYHLRACPVCRYRVTSLFPAVCPAPLDLAGDSEEVQAHLELCDGCKLRLAGPAPSRPGRARALAAGAICFGLTTAVLAVVVGRQAGENTNLRTAIARQEAAGARLRAVIATRDVETTQRPASGLVTGRGKAGTITLLQRMAHEGQAFKSLVAIGEAFMFAEHFDDAVVAFEEAKRVRPEEREPYKLLAAIHKIRSEHQRSIKNLSSLMALKHADADTFTFAGWGYSNLDQLAEARKMFKKALAMRPADGDALFNLALLEKKIGNTDEADEVMHKAREILSRDVREFPGAAVTHFKLAKVAAGSGHPDEALKHLRRAVARDAEWAFWAQYEDVFQGVWRKFPDARQEIQDLVRQFRFRRAERVVEDLS